jgi:hypothetical protein
MNALLAAWRLLYVTYGIVPIVAGLDKYFNYLVQWNIYISPSLLMINTTPTMINQIVGVIEILSGVLVLLKPRLGGYVVAAWLIAIAVNLVSMQAYYDIAVRDVVMAVGALALALLSKALNK